MEDKIKQLVEVKIKDLITHKEKRDSLRNRIRFCSQHKFEEEVRIANIQLAAMNEIIYDFEDTISGLQSILSKQTTK